MFKTICKNKKFSSIPNRDITFLTFKKIPYLCVFETKSHFHFYEIYYYPPYRYMPHLT